MLPGTFELYSCWIVTVSALLISRSSCGTMKRSADDIPNRTLRETQTFFQLPWYLQTEAPADKQPNYPKSTEPPPTTSTEPPPKSPYAKSTKPLLLAIFIPLIIVLFVCFGFKYMMCMHNFSNNTTTIHEPATQASIVPSFSSVAATAPNMEFIQDRNSNMTAPIANWIPYLDRPYSTIIHPPPSQAPISPFPSAVPTAPFIENGNSSVSAAIANWASTADRPPPYVEVFSDNIQSSKFPEVKSTMDFELPPPKYDGKIFQNKL